MMSVTMCKCAFGECVNSGTGMFQHICARNTQPKTLAEVTLTKKVHGA